MAEKKIDVEIRRDIWTPAGERIRKGTIASVDVDETVLDGIASGAVRRVTAEEMARINEAKAKAAR
jgi:hypothetical protein